MFRQELKKIMIISFFIFGLFFPFFPVSAFTILSTNKYAWSDNVGWINFAPVNAGVTVTDSELSGNAWSENKGYINFAPAEGGVLNDGTGNLSGSAWGEQLGYIDFDGVSINGSTGKFSGTATGTLIGTITFDCTFCDVETDWREAVASSGGGGSSGSQVSPPTLIPSLPALGLTESEQAKNVDIQKDGIINIFDFNAMMVNWGAVDNLASVIRAINSADVNQDGVVDIFDFNTLMVYWGITYQL